MTPDDRSVPDPDAAPERGSAESSRDDGTDAPGPEPEPDEPESKEPDAADAEAEESEAEAESRPRRRAADDSPLIPGRSSDDSDVGWDRGDDSNDQRLRDDVPPHW